MRRRNLKEQEEHDKMEKTSLLQEKGGGTDSVDGYDPLQFEEPKPKFPYKSVIFILFFLITGGLCITIGSLIASGVFAENYQDRIWPLFILGGIMFIPGGYYGWIVINILFGREGYTTEDIPVM